MIKEYLRSEILKNLEAANHRLVSRTGIDQFFKPLAEMSAASIPADFVSISAIEPETGEIEIKNQIGTFRQEWQAVYGKLKKVRQPVLITAGTKSHPGLVRMISSMMISSLVNIPLTIKDDVIGMITYIRTGDREEFSPSDLSFASILGCWSSMAIENARLYFNSRRYSTHARKLLDEISSAQENERKRVAIDIHDGVAQWLVGAPMISSSVTG
jgi:signal transduction histidine kinase